MRIIGNSKEGVIVEMTKDELAQAIGYSGTYDMDRNCSTAANVGQEHDLAQRVKYVREIEEIPRAVEGLRQSLSILDGKLRAAEAIVTSTAFIKVAEKKPVARK